MDCSPSGSSVHGILQARILGWSYSRGSIFLTQGSNPHNSAVQADSLPSEPPPGHVWSCENQDVCMAAMPVTESLTHISPFLLLVPFFCSRASHCSCCFVLVSYSLERSRIFPCLLLLWYFENYWSAFWSPGSQFVFLWCFSTTGLRLHILG